MRERTIKIVGLLLAVLMLASMSTVTFAKKTAKKTSKTYGVKVPSSIINGSDVTANRSFKNVGVKETYLAGVNLGASNKVVLQKYGNPTRIIVHSEPVQQNNTMGGMNTGMGMTGGMTGMTSGMTGMTGMNGGMTGMTGMGMTGGMPGMDNDMTGMNTMPGMTGGMNGMDNTRGASPMMGGAMGTTGNDMTGMNGGMNGGIAGTTGMGGSTMPGMGLSGDNADSAMSGMGGMTGMPGMGGTGQTAKPAKQYLGTSTRIASTSICWQYDLPSGVKLEFIIKNGKVSQITVISLYPWKYAKLKSGLMIGDTYKLVTYLWGINYKQQQVGSFSRCTYWDTKGAAIIFLNKKVVGMTVAAGDPII